METDHHLQFGSDVWDAVASLQFDFYKGNEREKKKRKQKRKKKLLGFIYLRLFSNKISTQKENFWTLTTSSSTDNDNYLNRI